MVNGRSFLSFYGTIVVVAIGYFPAFRHYMDLILLNFDAWLSSHFLALNEFKFIKFWHKVKINFKFFDYFNIEIINAEH
jgi:hypothetical protein